jgi:allantoicase
MNAQPTFPFQQYVNLAAERLGAKALLANDEFFAPKENLVKASKPEFIADKYTEFGKWMDGWETRRRRTHGHDWCIVKLGLRGIIKGVDVDTSHFLGNNPTAASLEACTCKPNTIAEDLPKLQWTEIIPQSTIQPGANNYFQAVKDSTATHVRLNIFPDGGVARLRVYGLVVPDWAKTVPGDVIDLAAVENGGVAVACSDMFFSSVNNMIMPGRALNMGDGWETRRRRGPGHDWAVLRLGRPGRVQRIELDTNFFKGNYPDTCSIDACYAPGTVSDPMAMPSWPWTEIVESKKLSPHKVHLFENNLKSDGPFTHLRLNIHPDGGVSRFRVWGTPE